MSDAAPPSLASTERDPPLRRAELLAALSLGADLGMGLPLENALRTAILAARLGEAIGFGKRELKDIYFISLLRNVGCTAEAAVAADVFGGDEIVGRGWMAAIDSTAPGAMLSTLVRKLGAGRSPLRRAGLVANALVKLPRLAATAQAQCEVAQSLANDLGCDLRVRDALGQAFERWDGKGSPGKKKGEAMCPALRVVQVADYAQQVQRAGGVEAVGAMLNERGGKGLDPGITSAMRDKAGDLLASLDVPSVWDAAMAAEPGSPDFIQPDQIDVGLRAIGAFSDLKSSYTRGHSAGVADLAAGALERMGLAPAATEQVRRAGYVHDVGRVGIAAGVWEKEGPLSEAEWEQVRRHPSYTEQILARPAMLARLGALAALDHERLDGTGYHKRVAGSLPPGARVLAAADMYQAMRETRPHRRAIAAGEVAAVLEKEAATGRLDRDAVAAVLATAKDRVDRGADQPPGGLREAELQVLRLLARGLSERGIAEAIHMPQALVAQHLGRMYEKIGVTTRAAAAMFAMHHGLVGLDL